MKKVNVFFHNRSDNGLLGQLVELEKNKIYFEFSSLALHAQWNLSPYKLPLKNGVFSGFPDFLYYLPGFIADSLPDGWGLLLMDKWFRKFKKNYEVLSPLDRLCFLGSRTMGSLTFEPALGSISIDEDWNLQKLAESSQKVLKNIHTEDLAILAYMGGSPHGARPKILIDYNKQNKKISHSMESLHNTWLVKFPAMNEHKEVCAIEALYFDLAKKSGLVVPEFHYFELNRQLSAFGLSRFDIEDKKRVPTFTLSGLLHADFRKPASIDYQSFLKFVKYLTKSEEQTLQAFRRCVFNVVFHNRDDHPKNFSFQWNENNDWILSPAYDLTWSPGPGGEHFMDICGEGKNPTLQHISQLAKQIHLSDKKVKQVLDQVLEAATEFTQAAKKYPIRKKTVTQLASVIQGHIKSCSL